MTLEEFALLEILAKVVYDGKVCDFLFCMYVPSSVPGWNFSYLQGQ